MSLSPLSPWSRSVVSGLAVAIAWLVLSVLAGLGFLALLHSQATGEKWFDPNENAVNPSLDETLGFVAAFLIAGSFCMAAILKSNRAGRVAIVLRFTSVVLFVTISIVIWSGYGVFLNQIRPWGTSQLELEVARQDLFACLAAAALVGGIVGLAAAAMVALISTVPPRVRTIVASVGFVIVLIAISFSKSPQARGVLPAVAIALRLAFGSNVPDRSVIGPHAGAIIGAVLAALIAHSLIRRHEGALIHKSETPHP